ncbi:RNA polymerase sigma factor [Niabella beijingensis]|uniref:RNA polymerase sigma factor n=1 Tax=Niabella beijingensis TaxID=2872700 RepID=UPI001CBCD4AC|nr:RNA polymerase sigma factor [Niabella beijingensis]MBZ4189750.1 RNA polymerase sigma factor [Niabella beijingensis]
MNYTTDQDALVERCRKGDKQAFYEVYHRYAKLMLNSSMRILNNPADAADMVQESFAIAFDRLETFTYKSSFKGWLIRIVINKSLELLRKRKKMQWVDVDLTDIEQEVEAGSPHDEYMFTNEQVKTAIDRLPENYRIIFNLYAVDNVSQDEIAKMLNISYSNVRTIYHRAKNKIKECLQNEYR